MQTNAAHEWEPIAEMIRVPETKELWSGHVQGGLVREGTRRKLLKSLIEEIEEGYDCSHYRVAYPAKDTAEIQVSFRDERGNDEPLKKVSWHR